MIRVLIRGRGIFALVASFLSVMGCAGEAVELEADPERDAAVCTRLSLGRAHAVDTVTLRRVERSGVPGESTEGGLTTSFFDGSELRVLRTTRFGEIGRLDVTYFFESAETYIIEYVESHYAEPINLGDVIVISRFREVFYVCDGKLVNLSADELAAELMRDLAALKTSVP